MEEAVSNVAIMKKIGKQVRQIIGTQDQLPSFFPVFNFFLVKLKLLRKLSAFMLLGLTLTSYMMVAFKKNNKFQKTTKTAKTIKSIDVS